MKRTFTLMLTAFLLLTGMSLWGQLRTEASIDFSEQGYENSQDMDGVVIAIDENVTVMFNKASGNNSPKYYNTGTAIRAYGGNNFIVSSTGTISSITLTFGSGDGSNEILTELGNFESPVWTGSESEVTFTIGGTSGHRRIRAIDVVYSSGGAPQQYVALPTFSPETGIYFEPQTVTISCETAGATIHYTMDGSTPTEDSPVFNSALTIDGTTTVKAKAWKTGYQPSPVATATYSITNLITIAEARSLPVNEYALVQGIVTFVDGRNVYVQDATGGICLFLNNNTIPSELALGDMVQAYGKRANYNGLAELSNINGSNSDEFAILSSGNTLPLVVKTIAEINEGGADALQCTRVKIEEATIGAINTSGNTPLTQGENSINIYKVPELTNIEEGNEVDVIGVVGYFNAAQIRVAYASDVVLSETPVIPDPELTVSATELNDFRYTFGEGPSAPKNFTISGVNLTDDVTLTAPQNFQLSMNPENGYFDTDELSPVGGTLNETTVYVRLKAGLEVGNYSGNLTIVSGGLSHNIALSGMVDEIPVVTMTIAEARALSNGQFAQVEGTVIFIDGRNVYIQDETAGIDLYLNSNTVPSGLAVGDNVRAYGSKTVYKGLVELSGINGNNADEFSVLSHNNTLPLAVKTIAEINSDFGGVNLLQSTRVKIEEAIIGAINPSGTTVISQDGNSLNIYLMPIVEGIAQGDEVTVTGVIGCYNTPQLRIASADDVTFGHQPILTANPNSISGLTYDYESGGPSEIASFVLEGNYLVGNVSVYPTESFEISTFAGEGFFPENPAMIYIPETNHFDNLNIYVRMKAGLEGGTYNEQIAIASPDADTLFVSITGTVTGGTPTPPDPPTPPTPGDGNYVRINDLSTLTAGSYVIFAARFDENATDYYAMSNSSSGKPTGVLFTSATANENEVLPASIVDEETSYYWIVGVTDNGYTFTNAAGELIGYSTSTNFATDVNTEWTIEFGTAGDEAMVPNYAGFLISNVNNSVRHFALNSNHNFGPYHTNNFNNSGYNFYLDIFMKTEGGEPPVPPTPTVATPTFSPAAGTYTEIQNVSITCATDGATIYYSTVSENGPWTEYTEAIAVEESVTIWAYAEKDGYNNSAVASATYTIQSGGGTMVTIFNQDWEGEMNGWTFVNVDGEMSWTVAQYSGNHYAYANGYSAGSAHANEDWCISPAFDLDSYSNEVLTFRTAMKFTGDTIGIYFSNNYDGEDPNAPGTIWTPLTGYALSQGNYEWVESGPVSLAALSGTNCYIAFKYTSTDTEAAAWEVDDIMLIGETSTSTPVVNVTPLTLSGFTYMEGEGPSDEQLFVISGTNLTEPIIVSNPDLYFQISRTSGNDFSNEQSITLDPTNGIIDQTIYVRMAAGLAAGSYSTTLIVNSEVGNINVTCNGNVAAQPVPGDDYVRIYNVSELVDGNRVVFAARFDENAADYYAMSNSASSHPTGVLFTSVLNGSEEILPSSILNEEDNFYWTVNVTADGYTFTNANGELIGYSSSTNFSPNGDNTVWSIEIGTSEETAMVPNYTGFVIGNVNNPNRAFALNGSHNFGAYHIQNMASETYNFFLDIFMQGEGGSCTVAAPTFSPAGGTYYEAQNVSINCSTPGANIYYSTISENGPWVPYSSPITVDENMTIWAYAELEGCNDSPVVSAEYVIQAGLTIIFNQDWEEDWHGWTEVCVEGDSLWRIASYQGNHYAYANGYNHPATEDWLISPAFDLDSYDNVVLSFRTAMNYTGDSLHVYFSNDYDGQDPTSATWQELECELSQGSWNWVESGEISLDEFSGSNCYIGFKYTCTDEEAAGWEVDDIMLVSGGISTDPYLIATPNALSGFSHVVGHGPSASQTFNLTGGNFLPAAGGSYGYVLLTLGDNSPFEISLNDEEYTSTLYIEIGGSTLDTTIFVRLWGDEIGQYDRVLLIEAAYQGIFNFLVTLSGEVLSADQPTISAAMPLYIQGNNGSNNNRVPVAIQVTLLNLEPNTTYRYTNQLVDGNDGPETAGAGNVIYVNDQGFYRSTSPSLESEGDYGEFTTSANGSQIVWFMNEPTANARFTPGNHVYLRIRLNDGHDGTEVANTFTTDEYATVLNFGTENDEYSGSAFYVKSEEAPMSFAMLLSDANDLRPLYSTSIETTGVDYGNINQYADFYKEEVAGNDGWFGGIIPNVNPNGINRILTWDLYSYSLNEYLTENGEWYPNANTVNPTNGLDEPIFIDLTYDGVEETVESNVKVWSADHEFVIENGDNAHYNMTVYNILGQPMIMKQINAGSTECISHSLATGVYIISLQNNQNAVSVKVIVK